MYSSSEIKRFPIEGPVLITPKAYGDDRGIFSETYRTDDFCEIIKMDIQFLQDNLSTSLEAGTVRGLHAQKPPHAIGKLVQCVCGSIVDIAVDVRTGSPTFGENVRVVLSAENRRQFWVPAGFLHGYSTVRAHTSVYYKQTGYYVPGSEVSVYWNDKDLALDWSVEESDVILSDKDAQAQSLAGFNSPFFIS